MTDIYNGILHDFASFRNKYSDNTIVNVSEQNGKVSLTPNGRYRAFGFMGRTPAEMQPTTLPAPSF